MIWVVLISVAFVVPFWILLPQYGLSKYWAIVAALPLCALALLYVMAFIAKPKGDRT